MIRKESGTKAGLEWPGLAHITGLAIILAWPVAASADIGTLFIPVQKANDTPYVEMRDTFDRDRFTAAGAHAIFTGDLFDNDGEYLVEPGTTWTWTWYRETPSKVRLGSVSANYVGGEDHCWGGGLSYCGTLGGITFTILAQCLPEEAHSVEVQQNGVVVGKEVFTPTDFRPALTLFEIDKESIAPTWPAKSQDYPVEGTTVRAEVRDSLDCGAVLDDVVLRFESNIAPGTGGHAHFTGEQIGTGRWATSLPGAVLDPEGDQTKGTMIDVPVTHEFGRVAIQYGSGEFGLEENIKLTPMRRNDEGTLVKAESETKPLQIRIPDLDRLPADNVVFAYGGSCPDHEPPPQFFTGTSYVKMDFVAWKYHQETGARLSLNDASMEFGGLIDNLDSNGRSKPYCHVSHRVGIDIDINNMDTAEKRLRDVEAKKRDENGNVIVDENGEPEWEVVEDCGTYLSNGVAVCRIKKLKSEMNKQGARQYEEKQSIHFRLEAPF